MRRRRALPQPHKLIGLRRWRWWLVIVEGDVVLILFSAGRRGCPGRDLGLRLPASGKKLLFAVVEVDAERKRQRAWRLVHPSLLRLAASGGRNPVTRIESNRIKLRRGSGHSELLVRARELDDLHLGLAQLRAQLLLGLIGRLGTPPCRIQLRTQRLHLALQYAMQGQKRKHEVVGSG
jgi:hypothetical protein